MAADLLVDIRVDMVLGADSMLTGNMLISVGSYFLFLANMLIRAIGRRKIESSTPSGRMDVISSSFWHALGQAEYTSSYRMASRVDRSNHW